MKIIDVSSNFKFKYAPRETREPGIHISNILKLMEKDGLKNWEAFTRLPDKARDLLQRRFEAGFVWEELMSLVFKERWALRPEPIEVDGIWMSPDGVFTPEQLRTFEIESDVDVLCEMKWTRRSIATPIDTWWKTIHQCKSYCYGLGLNDAIVHSCHWKGDYQWLEFTHDRFGVKYDKPIKEAPEMLPSTYSFYFPDAELEEWWTQVLAFANANFDQLIKMSEYKLD